MDDMKKGDCPNKGCYFSDEPEGMYMCMECTSKQTVHLSEPEMYDLYVDALEEFKNNGTFRRQIRSVDEDMVGDYELDCQIFENKMFEIVNGILIERRK